MSYQQVEMNTTMDGVEATSQPMGRKAIAALIAGAAVFATVGAVASTRSSASTSQLDATPPPAGVNQRGMDTTKSRGDDDQVSH
jgi:hypothetical protein|mmetsp:Transcript_103197/g.296170  ORF Transcript_103197/g.296170 Transcript_103197/m.296170 type:complete len:84 (-) Transcript_103197:7235-7486(-)